MVESKDEQVKAFKDARNTQIDSAIQSLCRAMDSLEMMRSLPITDESVDVAVKVISHTSGVLSTLSNLWRLEYKAMFVDHLGEWAHTWKIKDDTIELPGNAVPAVNDPCPKCNKQLEDRPGGGVRCVDPECGFWFCY